MLYHRQLNLFALALPFVIAAVEYLTWQGIYFAVMATMLTGVIQLFIAFSLVFENRIGMNLIVYLTLTVCFFLSMWLTDWQFVYLLPPFLAVYLTCILYLDDSQPFLKAQWKKLLLINYEVSPEILVSHLPAGTELELYKGKCYVSLVGFLFQNTRVCGFKVPNHVNFEEVNVRFYMTRKDDETVKRGVVFVKEIVPRRAIAEIANLLYKEHYETLPMRHSTVTKTDLQTIEYSWQKDNKWNKISATCSTELFDIEENSEAEFITEHYFGYTRADAQRTFEYEVTHPRWEQYKVADYTIDVDFKTNYGDAFAFLDGLQPTSVILAEGSEITVKNKRTVSVDSANNVLILNENN